MPAEVLVMCGQCGRPQPAGSKCVACGAALPEAVPERSGRDKLLEAFQPFLEADFGQGRTLALSQRRLEWRGAAEAKPITFEVARLESVVLHVRPVYEALIFAVPGLATLLLPLWILIPGLVLAALALAACFVQRRYAFRLRSKEGREAEIPLGMGRREAPPVVRILSIWESLAPELRELGVRTER